MQTLSSSPHHAHVIKGMFYNYEFIGNGAQFRVYAVHTHDSRPTNRVVKIPLDFAETRQAILGPLRKLDLHKSEEELDERADKRVREIMHFKHDVPHLIEGIIGKDTTLQRKIGHLKMLQVPIPSSKIDHSSTYYLPTLFTQDYVMTLDDYLQQFRLATNPYMRTLEFKTAQQLGDVIDQMISLNFAIWEYGIFEFVFKPENFGIRFNENGKAELIWIDLAEHITDQQEAERILGERRWCHALLPHKIDYQFMPTIIQEYYVKACDTSLTKENLRKYWRRKSNHIERTRSCKLRLQEIISRDGKKAASHWIARHNLSQSLHKGFPMSVIDDLEMPLTDIEKLMDDREYLTAKKTVSIEEKVERSMADLGETGRDVFPIVRPPFSYERERL